MKQIDDLPVVYETDLLKMSGAERIYALALGVYRWYVTYFFKSGMVYHEYLQPCLLAMKSLQPGTFCPESLTQGETPVKPEEQRKKEAEARNALWAQLSPVEQLAKLNRLFPDGARAQKARIISRLNSDEKAADAPDSSALPAPLGAANIVPFLPTMKKKDRRKARQKREELNEKRRKVMEKGGV